MTNIVVIGAGIGGLTTGALLAKFGYDVTVLEVHNYPGGCAGTFRRKGYRFDAGATLAGGFNSGEIMDNLAQRLGITNWHARFTEIPMKVHLPGEVTISRYGDKRRWRERASKFGQDSMEFWEWQEKSADLMWELAKTNLPWPPQNKSEFQLLLNKTKEWYKQNFWKIGVGLLQDALLPVNTRLRDNIKQLKLFIDAQLLISAQTTSSQANSLFAASALDLPRRGVVHFEGGIGTIAKQIEASLIDFGGTIKYRQKVVNIRKNSRKLQILTQKNAIFNADKVVANLTPWNLAKLLKITPPVLRKLPAKPTEGWGAVTLYLGIKDEFLPDLNSMHHQIISPGKLSEGNSIFLSVSPNWDNSRGPDGYRALTISTHTRFDRWWQLFNTNKDKYTILKHQYKDKLLKAARRVFPHILQAVLIEVGTPITFRHFTNRTHGWVGGFKQTNLFKNLAPQVSDRIWMVGDSIFPGQSIAAVSLGGIRVANSISNSSKN